ncbi:MAG: prolipoprotein diacylglyceryl transferase family protein [Aristaeellaceae bacterium]
MKQTNMQRCGGLAGMMTGIAVVLAVLALLVLVPTSPMLMTDTPEQLFCIATPAVLESIAAGELDPSWDTAGLPVTAYAACIAGSFVLALGLTACLSRSRGCDAMRGILLALVSGVCAFVLARLVYCVARWGAIVNVMAGDMGIDETTSFGTMLGGWLRFLIQPWLGGYSMYGAVLGALLGALIYARASGMRFAEAVDILVPGMLVMIAAGRAAEHFTLQGMSRYSVSEALNMLPFYSEADWALAVYAYEALAAVAALLVCLVLAGIRAPRGRVAETGLAIVSILQIMLDAWREDELIKFGFVRLNMILAAVVVVFVLVLRIVRGLKRHRGWTGSVAWTVVRCLLFLLSVAAVILVEFGMDGKFGITAEYIVLYGIQALAILIMGVSVLVGDGR